MRFSISTYALAVFALMFAFLVSTSSVGAGDTHDTVAQVSIADSFDGTFASVDSGIAFVAEAIFPRCNEAMLPEPCPAVVDHVTVLQVQHSFAVATLGPGYSFSEPRPPS